MAQDTRETVPVKTETFKLIVSGTSAVDDFVRAHLLKPPVTSPPTTIVIEEDMLFLSGPREIGAAFAASNSFKGIRSAFANLVAKTDSAPGEKFIEERSGPLTLRLVKT
ncbi:MAG: hypothetical protein WBK55_01870 [Alphaproteobacteria bacterium]